MAFEAAHDVDVGDYSFAQKNYKGALLRYQAADQEKPGDVAIVVRMARAFEKLGRFPEAVEQYKAAQKLAGPKKWTDAAANALVRLQGHPPS